MPPPLSKRSKPNPLKFLGQCPFPRSSNCSLLSSSFSMHLVGPMPISKELKLNYWFNSFLVINFLELWNKLLFFAMQLKTIAKLPSKTKFFWFCKAEISEAWNSWILHSGNFASTVAEIAPFACQTCGGRKSKNSKCQLESENLSRYFFCYDISKKQLNTVDYSIKIDWFWFT